MTHKKNDTFADHPTPTTRREFLARGTLGFSATVLAPSLLGSLLRSSQVRADSCGPPAGNDGYIPFLVFDCAGGAALPGNFLAGGAGGPQDLLPSYDLLGWNPRASGALDLRFGLPMAKGVSQILAGINATCSPQAQANLRMGSLLHFSQDDSQNNPLSAIALAMKLGAAGSVVNRGLGTEPSLSGGNSGAAEQASALQPVTVGSLDDVLNAVSFGPAMTKLSLSLRQSIVQSALAMSLDQLTALGSAAPQGFTQQVSCAFQKALGYASGSAALDPRTDAAVTALYGLANGTAFTDPKMISAAIVMNVLKKFTGPGVITIGGCDYHDGSQTSGDAKDLEIGQEIGRAVQAAYLLKTPLFFQVLTDGGLFAMKGTRNWGGDAGDKSMTVIGYYRPEAAPVLAKPLSPQIGAYNVGQGADQSTLIGGDPSKVAYSVFANYLNICGKLTANADLFSTVLGTGGVDQVLLFD